MSKLHTKYTIDHRGKVVQTSDWHEDGDGLVWGGTVVSAAKNQIAHLEKLAKRAAEIEAAIAHLEWEK